MSTNRVRTPEQQLTYPQQYPQYPYPAPYYNPFSPPKKDRTGPIVAVVIAVVAAGMIIPAFMSMFVFRPTYDDMYNDDVPMAFDSNVDVEGPTKAKVSLSRFTRDPAATEFRVILEMAGNAQGTYEFPSDTDCELVFVSGTDIADLYYVDVNNNVELDPGDEISITNLAPNSFYMITIIYIPTGYESTYNSFWTPDG